MIEVKDPDGSRLLTKFTRPRNPTKKDQRLHIWPHEDPIDGPKFYEYNRQDVRAEMSISEHTPDLDDIELQFWLTDQEINQRGIAVDMKGVDDCIAIVMQCHDKYNAELTKLTGGKVKEASELPALREWCQSQGFYLANMQEETIADAIDRLNGDPDTLMIEPALQGVLLALTIRAKLGSASVKKLFSLKAQSCYGRVYDLYQYFAARTGRWTGNGPQPQNFYKGAFKKIEEVEYALSVIASRSLELVEYEFGDALECVSNCLRGLLIAGPGKELICSDFTAIEGVITAALAGEEWRLEVFRTHGKIYEASAARLFGVPFETFAAYKAEHGSHHPLRDKGKRIELGAGFGGWVGAMKSSQIRLDEIMDDYQIKQAILGWREASPAVPELWGGQSRGTFGGARWPQLYGLEGCAIAAVQNPGEAFQYRGVVYQTIGDVLVCMVPDGGTIKYHMPRLAPSERPYAEPWELELTYEGWNSNPKAGPMGWVRMGLYGGKQTENVVQKIGRTYMANALVRLNRNGYPIVIHSHDEPVAEVPLGYGSIAEFEQLMVVCPHPAYEGWPIKAKGGWRGQRYGKFE